MRKRVTAPPVEVPSLCFMVGDSVSGATPFTDTASYDASDFVVKVNDQETSMTFDSITLSAGDKCEIVSKSGSKFPRIIFSDSMNVVSKILKPFPPMWTSGLTDEFYNCSMLTEICDDLLVNNPQVDDVDYFFQNSGILVVPGGTFKGLTGVTAFKKVFSGSAVRELQEGVFDSFENVTDFEDCFYNCSDLTTIPDTLFDKCVNTTHMKWTFQKCSSLTGVGTGLLAKLTKLENVFKCFSGCESLVVDFDITATEIIDADDFAWDTVGTGTVRVPAGSTTASTFASASDANVTVIEV